MRSRSRSWTQLGLDRFALYLQDYGAPIGLRIASRHPHRVTALISQNGNAYVDGFTPFWDGLFAYADDGVTNAEAARASMDPEGTRWVYTHGVPPERRERLSPDAWIVDQAALDRPGNRELQLALFRDYPSNIDEYPVFQEYFRTHRPPALIAWGEHDEIFGADGARAFARDLPEAEIHLLDAGHYALESQRRRDRRPGPRRFSTASCSECRGHSSCCWRSLPRRRSRAPSTPRPCLTPSRPISASTTARQAQCSRSRRSATRPAWSRSCRSGMWSTVGG